MGATDPEMFSPYGVGMRENDPYGFGWHKKQPRLILDDGFLVYSPDMLFSPDLVGQCVSIFDKIQLIDGKPALQMTKAEGYPGSKCYIAGNKSSPWTVCTAGTYFKPSTSCVLPLPPPDPVECLAPEQVAPSMAGQRVAVCGEVTSEKTGEDWVTWSATGGPVTSADWRSYPHLLIGGIFPVMSYDMAFPKDLVGQRLTLVDTVELVNEKPVFVVSKQEGLPDGECTLLDMINCDNNCYTTNQQSGSTRNMVKICYAGSYLRHSLIYQRKGGR